MLSMEVCMVHAYFAFTSRVSHQHKHMTIALPPPIVPQSILNYSTSGQNSNSSHCTHADDEYTTATSASSTNQTARSGAKAGQIQEPLTDLEQLEPEEDEDLDFGNAGQQSVQVG